MFAVVKSFEYKIAISANFVQTVKNSNKQLDANRDYRDFCKGVSCITSFMVGSGTKSGHSYQMSKCKLTLLPRALPNAIVAALLSSK